MTASYSGGIFVVDKTEEPMMSPEITHFIAQYGYWAIFLLVFLQEVGVPNPIPNELLLICAGFMCFGGALSLTGVIAVVMVADLSGTCTLYFLSFSFGNYLLTRKPRLPIPYHTIERLKEKVARKGLSGIFVGRLSPFIRGYVSVSAGLLQVRPPVYLPIAVGTALIWALVYVLTGYFLGPYRQEVMPYLQNIGLVMFAVLLVVLLTTVVKRRMMSRMRVQE